jgi:hypothetical protein
MSVSPWLKGLVLTLAYFILSASFFCHAEPPQYGLSSTSKVGAYTRPLLSST